MDNPAVQTRRRVAVIGAVLALHAAIGAVLLCGVWHGHDPVMIVLLAWPFSEVSLVALWGISSGVPLYLRFPLASFGLAWAWCLAVHLLERNSLRDAESAGWALMVFTQAAVVMIGTSTGYLVLWLQRRWQRGAARGDARHLQFSLGSLLLLTTALAVVLGLARWAFAALGWTADVMQWEYFFFCPVLGAFNAAFALAAAASMAGRRLAVRAAIAVAAIAAIAYLESDVFELLFGQTGGISVAEFLTLAGSQTAFLYATLVPLRLAGCFPRGNASARRQRAETVLAEHPTHPT